MGLVLGICSGAVIVLYCTGAMISVIDFMDKLAQMGGLSQRCYPCDAHGWHCCSHTAGL